VTSDGPHEADDPGPVQVGSEHDPRRVRGEEVAERIGGILGLDAESHGSLHTSALTATLDALAAARERADLDIRQRGMAGRPDLPMLRIYASEGVHPAVERAALLLGLGRDGIRTVPGDGSHGLDVDLLAEAVAEDVRFGYLPLAIVGRLAATVIDPIGRIGELRDGLTEELGHEPWLHVDGVEAGMAAVCEELRWVLDGTDQADSLVVDTEGWMPTPEGCSLLFVRDPDLVAHATSPEPGPYADLVRDRPAASHLDILALSSVLDHLSAEGPATRIRRQLRQAERIAAWVESRTEVERAAPAPLATVCFRARPTAPLGDEAGDELNRSWRARIVAAGVPAPSIGAPGGLVALCLSTLRLDPSDELTLVDVLDATLDAALAAAGS